MCAKIPLYYKYCDIACKRVLFLVRLELTYDFFFFNNEAVLQNLKKCVTDKTSILILQYDTYCDISNITNLDIRTCHSL